MDIDTIKTEIVVLVSEYQQKKLNIKATINSLSESIHNHQHLLTVGGCNGGLVHHVYGGTVLSKPELEEALLISAWRAAFKGSLSYVMTDEERVTRLPLLYHSGMPDFTIDNVLGHFADRLQDLPFTFAKMLIGKLKAYGGEALHTIKIRNQSATSITSQTNEDIINLANRYMVVVGEAPTISRLDIIMSFLSDKCSNRDIEYRRIVEFDVLLRTDGDVTIQFSKEASKVIEHCRELVDDAVLEQYTDLDT